jgi:hypothetical protein
MRNRPGESQLQILAGQVVNTAHQGQHRKYPSAAGGGASYAKKSLFVAGRFLYLIVGGNKALVFYASAPQGALDRFGDPGHVGGSSTPGGQVFDLGLQFLIQLLDLLPGFFQPLVILPLHRGEGHGRLNVQRFFQLTEGGTPVDDTVQPFEKLLLAVHLASAGLPTKSPDDLMVIGASQIKALTQKAIDPKAPVAPRSCRWALVTNLFYRALDRDLLCGTRLLPFFFPEKLRSW